ncbi:MAG: glycosyltransferase family 2 protein [Oligoflexia bacterium]|nr:glycosyltransferase family 2 protein [Oligoflexia bacterium]
MTTTNQRAKVSAFVICFNEQNNIRRCLESLRWCDEIVIVDSGSTDNTLSICREFTDRVFSRAWPGHREQKRYALSLCTHEWILNIDADEVIDDELRSAIQLALQNDDSAGVNGYYLNRVVFHLGKWWRKGGWYPEYRLRFCRRSVTTWGGLDPHEKACVTGPTKRLPGEIQHFSYPDLSGQVHSLNRLSSAAAKAMWADGQRTSFIKIFTRPIARFVKFYFLRKGFLEGFEGFVVAILEAYYAFLKYVKVWEIERANTNVQS